MQSEKNQVLTAKELELVSLMNDSKVDRTFADASFQILFKADPPPKKVQLIVIASPILEGNKPELTDNLSQSKKTSVNVAAFFQPHSSRCSLRCTLTSC
jgi:hypothetical protein